MAGFRMGDVMRSPEQVLYLLPSTRSPQPQTSFGQALASCRGGRYLPSSSLLQLANTSRSCFWVQAGGQILSLRFGHDGSDQKTWFPKRFSFMKISSGSQPFNHDRVTRQEYQHSERMGNSRDSALGQSFQVSTSSRNYSRNRSSSDAKLRRSGVVCCESDNTSTYGVENDTLKYAGAGEAGGEAYSHAGVDGTDADDSSSLSEFVSTKASRVSDKGIDVASATFDPNTGGPITCDMAFMPYVAAMINAYYYIRVEIILFHRELL